jgi:hypothetical protein
LVALTLLAQPEPWLGEDEVLHLAAAGAIAAAGYAVGAELAEPGWYRFLVGSAFGLAAGAAKELSDLAIGEPSAKDFAFSAVGAGMGAFVAWLIDRVFFGPAPPFWLARSRYPDSVSPPADIQPCMP